MRTVKRELTEEQRAKREENRMLNPIAVLACLQAEQLEVWKLAEVVGEWIWVRFEEKPSEEVRNYLSDLGFHWNRTRGVWQHCGGKPSRHTSGDPRFTYGVIEADKVILNKFITA